MKTLEELKKAKEEALGKMQGLLDTADNEDRDLSEDESSQYENLKAEIGKLDKQIKRKEELADMQSQHRADMDKTSPGKISPSAGADKQSVDDSGKLNVQVDEPEIMKDDSHGFESFDEFAACVYRGSQKTNAVIDDRFKALEAAYGQNTFSGEEGGFLIPPNFSNRLLERAQEKLEIVKLCDKITIGSGNSLTVNGMVDHDKSGTSYRYGGIVVYWVDEAGQITKSNLKFRQVDLKLKKLAALAYATEEELSDANLSFGSRLTRKMGDAIGDELAEALMFGNGVGRPQGAFSSNAAVTVSKEAGQAASTIVAENIDNMYARVWPKSHPNLRWFYNQECHPQLRQMSIDVGTGGVMAFIPPGGMSATPYATINGKPAYITDHCEALGTAGDIVCADWGQYLLLMKGTIRTAMSMHLRFDYDEVAFKAVFRVDGQPAWDRALTPRKGSNTLSPFLKLQTRS